MITKLGPGAGRKAFLDYEVSASWIAPLIWFEWGQNIMAYYLAGKTNRKYNRYLRFLRTRRNLSHNNRMHQTSW